MLHGNTGAWPTTSTISAGGISGGPIIEEFQWATNGPFLSPGVAYAINYHCEAQ
jgi:hypothetical protein